MQFIQKICFEPSKGCPNDHILDRDINASKNILEEGLRIIGAELSDYTDGGSDKTSEKKHKPMKSEAH